MNVTEKITAVADASFVIGVSVCEQWKTLEELVSSLIIVNEVWVEVVSRGYGKPGQKELENSDFVERKTVSNTVAVDMLTTTLDKGEAETIVLATELGAKTVFMDDLRGRKIAHSVGIQTIGVAGFLLLAKKKEIVPEVRTSFIKLQKKGFRLSKNLVNKILHEAGEEPIETVLQDLHTNGMNAV